MRMVLSKPRTRGVLIEDPMTTPSPPPPPLKRRRPNSETNSDSDDIHHSPLIWEFATPPSPRTIRANVLMHQKQLQQQCSPQQRQQHTPKTPREHIGRRPLVNCSGPVVVPGLVNSTVKKLVVGSSDCDSVLSSTPMGPTTRSIASKSKESLNSSLPLLMNDKECEHDENTDWALRRIDFFDSNDISTVSSLYSPDVLNQPCFTYDDGCDRVPPAISAKTPDPSRRLSGRRAPSQQASGGLVRPHFDGDGDGNDMNKYAAVVPSSSCYRGHNVNRYHREFIELCQMGEGDFGAVFKCRNRLDSMVYAIKQSLRPIGGELGKRKTLREVVAHAVMEDVHVVRYYGAWEEDDRMFIQNEFCDGGSLADQVAAHVVFGERECVDILRQVAGGLAFIHGKGRAHMDIKPGNIFIWTQDGHDADIELAPVSSDSDSEFCVRKDCSKVTESSKISTTQTSTGDAAISSTTTGTTVHLEEPNASKAMLGVHGMTRYLSRFESIVGMAPSSFRRTILGPEIIPVYKIGDLGHVTELNAPLVEEGDVRYMALELLKESCYDLTKADIFSLGLLVLELAIRTPLPKNGPSWQALREGILPELPVEFSSDFRLLLSSLLSPEPKERPDAEMILAHPLLVDKATARQQELLQQLNEERLRASFLENQLKEEKERTSQVSVNPAANNLPSGTIVARKSIGCMNRSLSVCW